MIRALLDQGLPRSSVGLLRDAGWDVIHVGDIGLASASDARILERADRDRRMIVTLDADFHRLLAVSGAQAPSVVRVREEGLTAGPLARLLANAVSRAEQAIAAGALVKVTAKAVRIRALPIVPARPAST